MERLQYNDWKETAESDRYGSGSGGGWVQKVVGVDAVVGLIWFSPSLKILVWGCDQKWAIAFRMTISRRRKSQSAEQMEEWHSADVTTQGYKRRRFSFSHSWDIGNIFSFLSHKRSFFPLLLCVIGFFSFGYLFLIPLFFFFILISLLVFRRRFMIDILVCSNKKKERANSCVIVLQFSQNREKEKTRRKER